MEVQNYMPLAGGIFAGDVFLNAYSLKFTNTSTVGRVFNQTELVTLFNGCTTWISSIPTTLPATTFSGNIAMGVNGITYINSSGITKSISQGMLETLDTGSSTWLTVTPIATQ